jgi:ABC-2 type transport system permease protein
MTTQSRSAISEELILAARRGLLPVRENTWLGGFGNMLRKEMGQWWGTRAWWVQIIIWVLILNGITTIIITQGNQSPEITPADAFTETVQTFLPIAIFAIGIGTITTVQGSIVGEKELGTAAWMMSKPVSRSAFILAKALAFTVGFWVSAILVPSVIFIIEMGQLAPTTPLALGPFLIGVALVALSQLFYLMLTLMLGTLFNSRRPITGIAIAFIMSGLLLKSIFPPFILAVTPWPLADIASAITLRMDLPSIWPVPIVVTGIWIIVMTAVALWRFGREEF